MTSDESLNTPMNHRWAVLNCAVTQVLGTYATEAEAGAAAEEYGCCSFAYEITPDQDTQGFRDGPQPAPQQTLTAPSNGQ